MTYQTIPFSDTGYFSKIIIDYLSQDEKLAPFYNNYPNLNGFKKQLEEKRLSVRTESRTTLVEALKNQYKDSSTSEKSKKNIELLESEKTFTVTTGHQLNLFTGPLYFLYKIVSAINLSKQLKEAFPKDNFVPVYWMATEDHDFEEINYFNFNGKKVSWNLNSSGGVGRLSTQGLEEVLAVFSAQLGTTKNANYLRELFRKTYIEHTTLTEATRYLANELFSDYGLVIVDGDDVNLKREFLPFIKDELFKNTSYKEVSKTISSLDKNYKVQVPSRN